MLLHREQHSAEVVEPRSLSQHVKQRESMLLQPVQTAAPVGSTCACCCCSGLEQTEQLNASCNSSQCSVHQRLPSPSQPTLQGPAPCSMHPLSHTQLYQKSSTQASHSAQLTCNRRVPDAKVDPLRFEMVLNHSAASHTLHTSLILW